MKGHTLICFIGIDGSGKSTLSKYLYEELKKREYNVSYIWWLEGEYSLLRKLLRTIGKPIYKNLRNCVNTLNVRKSKSIAIHIFNILYPKLVLLDYLRFGILKMWLPKIINNINNKIISNRDNKIIILDRYIYDIILFISEEFNYPISKKIKLLNIYSKLLPSPDLIFIIDVPPEVSYFRKREEIRSIKVAKLMWKNYQELYFSLNNLTSGKIIRIDNTKRLEEVKADILKTTLDFINGDENGR